MDKQRPELGDVQQTLFVTLLARAAETRRRHPALRDPKAVEIAEAVDIDPVYGLWAGVITIVRTLVFDYWVREFLREHPEGTVVDLGTGLNTRFERCDNGRCHWLDLDLPDTIALRRQFFADSPDGRRRMIAGSVTSAAWHDAVAACPPPYFFVSEGVLVYLPPGAVRDALSGLAARFPGAVVSFDTYGKRSVRGQRQSAQRRNMAARWQWACDDPRELEPLGLRLAGSVPVTRSPAPVARALPARCRWLLRLISPVLGGSFILNRFQAAS
ncbi:MAG TPA: class I SAM-dependent methyltransferase [Trebonia sp.]|jgi:O-methyltransferase involved in polyketide biosynthesis|nr:class I SAM-dependent methyltransferase [Trebonia sp.]